jgi:hypothetical protein
MQVGKMILKRVGKPFFPTPNFIMDAFTANEDSGRSAPPQRQTNWYKTLILKLL